MDDEADARLALLRASMSPRRFRQIEFLRWLYERDKR